MPPPDPLVVERGAPGCVGEQLASGPGGTRAAEPTRRALVEAATAVFAEVGYHAASVRAITAKARTNQGAITYHFGGKEGLYREVLRTARGAMSDQPLLRSDTLEGRDRGEILTLFFRQTLAPLGEGGKFRRYLRVFAWEQLKPTAVREKLSTEEPFPTLVLARAIVRHCLPDADERTVGVTTAWLLGQTMTFVRDADWLARPPLGLKFARDEVEQLVETLTSLCLPGLSGNFKGVAQSAAAHL